MLLSAGAAMARSVPVCLKPRSQMRDWFMLRQCVTEPSRTQLILSTTSLEPRLIWNS